MVEEVRKNLEQDKTKQGGRALGTSADEFPIIRDPRGAFQKAQARACRRQAGATSMTDALAESLPQCNVHEASEAPPDSSLEGSLPLQITLIDLVLAKHTIPIAYSPGWAVRRPVAEPQR
jgi:hypothetical protein